MKVKWHCRNCNETGEQEVSLNIVLKVRAELIAKEEKAEILGIIMAEVDHHCSKPNIGVMPI